MAAKTPIDSKAAVKAAYDYFMQVSPTPNRFSNFRLEQLETDKNKDYLITLSYEVQGEFGFDKQREYKDFKVEKDGTVVSMTIHKS